MERKKSQEVSSRVVLKGRSLGQLQQHHLGTCSEFKFVGVTPDLLSQQLWDGLRSPPGGSGVLSSWEPLVWEKDEGEMKGEGKVGIIKNSSLEKWPTDTYRWSGGRIFQGGH